MNARICHHLRVFIGALLAVMLLLPLEVVAGGSPPKSQGLRIQLTSLGDARISRMSDSVVLRFQITNVGSAPIGIFTELGMGYQGGVILHVLRPDGSEIQKPVLYHSSLQSGDVDNQHNYTELMPNHFIGMVQEFKISDLVAKPGHYKLLAEYHSPVDSNDTTIRNFFGAKENSVVSNTVKLDVLP